MSIRNLIAAYATYTDASELSANLGASGDIDVTTTSTTPTILVSGMDVLIRPEPVRIVTVL
ncbi:hypothetical protein [Actinocrispum sp. NPDC049592]|uniref:hypothetical protein n=1 Tax=Actinocrispum sp. NPDC049592 TaxID=3154835 RepID=UPI00343B622C